VNGPYALRERSVRFSPGLAGAYPNSAGDEARDLVAAVLGGENLAVVTDADIVLMAPPRAGRRSARRFIFILEGIHELPELAPDSWAC
jgi:hypothetical protein